MAQQPDREVPEGVAVFPEIPAELGIDPLLLAVLHATVFLDGSHDTVIDPDAAEEALEYLASYLQRLEGPRLLRVREDLEVLAGFAREEKWGPDEVGFVQRFLSHFGVKTGE